MALSTKPAGTSWASASAPAVLPKSRRARARPVYDRLSMEALPEVWDAVIAWVNFCSAMVNTCAAVSSGPPSTAAEQKPSPSRM